MPGADGRARYECIGALVGDDAAQSAVAKRLVRSAVRAKETLFLPVTVMLELEWVLRSSFGFTKPAVVLALSQLLSTVELSFDSEAAVESVRKALNKSIQDLSEHARQKM